MGSKIDYCDDQSRKQTQLFNISANESNYSTSTDDDGRIWSLQFSIVVSGIMAVCALVNVVGNFMVLTVIIRHRGMRTRTNLFLVNLAVADILVGVLVVPVSVVTILQGNWKFDAGGPNDPICVINSFLNAFCLITSIQTLMFISIHKYFSIVRPLGVPIKLRSIIIMMATAWVWAAVWAAIIVVGLSTAYKPGTSQCGPCYPSTTNMYIIHVAFQLCNLILPFGIMVFCYGSMFKAIREHSKRMQTNTTVEVDTILSQQKKVMITMFIVLACFLVLVLLPYAMYATYVTITKDKDHFSEFINPLAYMLVFSNSMCNPIIYAFRSPAFREGYKEILCQTPSYVISDGPMGTLRCQTRSQYNRGISRL